jgi:hypothetical protein
MLGGLTQGVTVLKGAVTVNVVNVVKGVVVVVELKMEPPGVTAGLAGGLGSVHAPDNHPVELPDVIHVVFIGAMCSVFDRYRRR